MSKAVPPGTTSGKKPRARFLHEVVLELRKVKWPTRQDVVQLTGVVLTTIVVVGIYVAVLDFGVGKVFQSIGMYGFGH